MERYLKGPRTSRLSRPGIFQLNASGLAAALLYDVSTNTLGDAYLVGGGQ